MKRDEEFAEIFHELYPKLCRFLEGMLGRQTVAQDLAQESFLQFYRKGAGSIAYGEARFWLFRVARNLALNELDKHRRRGRLFHKLQEAFAVRPRDPEAELLLSEEKRAVIKLINVLPEDQRAALLLREQEEMSYSEIARVLKVSESKVKVDIFRARNRLRKSSESGESSESSESPHKSRVDKVRRV